MTDVSAGVFIIVPERVLASYGRNVTRPGSFADNGLLAGRRLVEQRG